MAYGHLPGPTLVQEGCQPAEVKSLLCQILKVCCSMHYHNTSLSVEEVPSCMTSRGQFAEAQKLVTRHLIRLGAMQHLGRAVL